MIITTLIFTLVIVFIILTCFLDQMLIAIYSIFFPFFEDDIFSDKYSLYLMKNGYLGVHVKNSGLNTTITAINPLNNDVPISIFDLS